MNILKAHEYNYLGVWIMGYSDNRGSDKLRMDCRVVTILGYMIVDIKLINSFSSELQS